MSPPPAIVAPATCELPAIVEALPRRAGTVFVRRHGALESVPYGRVAADAQRVAGDLVDLGVGAGDRVGVHGDTSYDWLLADLACVLIGALSISLYPSAPPDRIRAVLSESRCRIVLTDRDELAAHLAGTGVAVEPLRRDAGPADGPPVQAPVRSGPFTVVSTSGTLSEPKLFSVHSEPLLATMDRMAEIYGFRAEDRLLLYLPLSHLPQRMMVYWGLRAGMDLVLSDPAHIVADSVALAPTLHVSVPRALEHLLGRIRTARDQGMGPTEARDAVFGPALRALFVGSAPSDPAVLEELEAVGLPVFEVYGTTELGMIGLNTPGATRRGSVGRPVPWGEVCLDPDTDEVLVRTPTPFLSGRLVDGEIVPEVLDGWQSTGDIGRIDDGYLSILGRSRDFVSRPNGEKVFLAPIEHALATATGADLCVVVPTGAGQLGALLFFDPAGPGVPGDPAEEIRRVNGGLHAWERVRRWAVVEGVPSTADGCLTETTKLRRHRVDECYGRRVSWLPV